MVCLRLQGISQNRRLMYTDVSRITVPRPKSTCLQEVMSALRGPHQDDWGAGLSVMLPNPHPGPPKPEQCPWCYYIQRNKLMHQHMQTNYETEIYNFLPTL